MSTLGAWLGRGAAGLEAPRPLEFASLVPPRSPNTCLAAPEGHPGPKQFLAPILPASPEVAFETLLRLAGGFPRTWRLASWPERRQAQWVERSALANFPDIITAECVPAPGGSTLFLYSRSLIGYSDFGANAKRVSEWLTALADSLTQALAPALAPALTQAPAPPLALAEPEEDVRARPNPSALASAVASVACGRNVLLSWDDPIEMPEAALTAVEAGALTIQAISPDRPDRADQFLAEAGVRLGLTGEAEAILASRPAQRDSLPPPLHADPGAWRPWWMRGSLHATDLRARLGEVDLVVHGGNLACIDGDPPRLLAGLLETGARQLILRTAVITETPLLEAVGFSADTLWHAGELAHAQSAALDVALREVGVTLPQFTAFPGRLTREAVEASQPGEIWWWFMGEGALERLLREAGWTIRTRKADGAHVIVTASR